MVQAAKLAGQLKVPEGALWVVSPLTRAVQTFYLARRRPEPPPSRDHYLSTAVSLPAKVAPCSRLGSDRMHSTCLLRSMRPTDLWPAQWHQPAGQGPALLLPGSMCVVETLLRSASGLIGLLHQPTDQSCGQRRGGANGLRGRERDGDMAGRLRGCQGRE